MAKGNALLGTLRGSVGDVTFTQVNGKQVMRKRNTSPKNPKTSKQVYQRMFFATIAKAKAAMSQIVDHSFENLQHGQKSLNYFMKRNIALMRANVVFDPQLQIWVSRGASYVAPNWASFAPNTYRVSEGSLTDLNDISPAISVRTEDVPDDFPSTINLPTTAPWLNYFSPGYSNPTAVQMLTESLQGWGVQKGDYLTLLVFTAKQSDINMGAGVEYPLNFHFIRFRVLEYDFASVPPEGFGTSQYFCLVPTNVDGANYILPDVRVSEDGSDIYSLFIAQRSEGELVHYPWLDLMDSDLLYWHITSPDIDGELTSPFGHEALLGSDDVVVASTWIHSRIGQNGIIKVSSQDMILADPTGDVLDLNLGLRDAYDEWLASVRSIGDDQYILEGGAK